MKNINKFFIFIKNLPFFHFFFCASSINKLVIFWTLSSLFYLINYCLFDSYEFFSKRPRQKGKILPNLLFTISRQISRFVKILYIKDPLNQTEWTEDIMDRVCKRQSNRGTEDVMMRIIKTEWHKNIRDRTVGWLSSKKLNIKKPSKNMNDKYCQVRKIL